MTHVTEQQLFTIQGLEGLEGKWVAIRDGRVIASADSLGALRENEDVRRDDAVYVVPESHPYFF